jgi:serine/threonine protein kinase/tetratricopeptide (TPR) repeat protein
MDRIRRQLEEALAGRYRVERELGAGGMATVYLAHDPKHRREVAIKVLHPELTASIGAERFAREIRVSAKLQHPHILTLIDSGEADGQLYYVMPFVAGESLRDRLEREERLPLRDALRIAEQVASALGYAHEHGVVHRDIKPANILLAGDQAIVADFGISRAVQSGADNRLTGSGLIVGTPAYMSPEQAFEGSNVDGRTDTYALGCVLFEMLAGRPPFEAPSTQALLAQHAVASPPSLRDLAPDTPLFVDRAICQSLAKEPDGRFASPIAFADVLRSGTVVAPVGRRRLAVLPPENLTGDEDQQFLVLGLHEALISQLGRGNDAVLARTSVLQYRGTSKTAREICRELAVDAVVESSLFRSGDTIGVQARLIDGNTEEGIWSGSRDGAIDRVFALYREFSEDMATGIHGRLKPGPAGSGSHRAVDPRAYENYMRGRVTLQEFNPAEIDRAMQYFEAALAIQPDYAAAYAGISIVWDSRIVHGIVSASEGEPAREMAKRAVELDPNLAEAHQVMALGYVWGDFDWVRGEASLRRAIELDPNEPHTRVFYSHLLAMLLRKQESDLQIRRAMEIDPFNPFTQLCHALQRGLVGQFEEGIAAMQTVPAHPLRAHGLAGMNFALGRIDEGVSHYADTFALLGDLEMAGVLRNLAHGPEAAMIRAAELLVERARHRFVKPNHMVHLFTWGGDIDRAIEWLERSYEMRDHEITYAAVLWLSDALKADPRFRAFLKKMNLPIPD